MAKETRSMKVAGTSIDGHRLSEFVYGTVMVLVTVAAVGSHPTYGPVGTAIGLVLTAAAIWLAHGYAQSLAKRVTGGHRLTSGEIGRIFWGSWPIVSAGVLMCLPVLLALTGIWSLELGLDLASLVGVVILFAVGWLAAALAGETIGRRVMVSAVYGGLGVAIVVIKFALGH